MDLDEIDPKSTITLVSAGTGIEFTVHKDLISTASPFVKACLHKGIYEGTEDRITISDWADEESVRVLIIWLFQGKNALKMYEWECHDMVPTWLYLLADRFLMPELKNDIVDKYMRSFNESGPNMDAFTLLHEKDPAECKLKNVPA